MFDTDDGKGGGEFCVSEQNVNRQVFFPSSAKSRLAETSSDEDEEDVESDHLEIEPLGPSFDCPLYTTDHSDEEYV